MKTIVITGPSGSGKTYFTNKLLKFLDDTIVIKTDSYYRDDKLIKLLSILKNDIYDRIASLKKRKIMNTLNSIYRKEGVINNYFYDFKEKKSIRSKIQLNYSDDNQFLILEGIFAHRLDLNYQDTVNIECTEDKEICYERRIKRDKAERGRNLIEVRKRFSKSWYLFHKNVKQFKNSNNVITLNPSDKDSRIRLINILMK